MQNLVRTAVCAALIVCASLSITAQGTNSPDDLENYFKTKHPFMSLTGGITNFNYNGDANFQKDVSLGVVLGFTSTNNAFKSSILETDQGGVYVSFNNAGDTASGNASVQAWRFGFEQGSAYGYSLDNEGTTSVDFYSTRAPLSWFSQNFPAQGVDSATAMQLLGRFDGSVRFGESSRASVGFRVANPVTITASFEWAQAYERHLFWYWLMSTAIEGVADGLGSYFVSAVGKGSPMAAPIIHFIIRNGIAMGFKALRQNQMNWPFTTAAPLNYFNYSIGVSLKF